MNACFYPELTVGVEVGDRSLLIHWVLDKGVFTFCIGGDLNKISGMKTWRIQGHIRSDEQNFQFTLYQ